MNRVIKKITAGLTLSAVIASCIGMSNINAYAEHVYNYDYIEDLDDKEIIDTVTWKKTVTLENNEEYLIEDGTLDDVLECTAKVYSDGRILLKVGFHNTIPYVSLNGDYIRLGNIRTSSNYAVTDHTHDFINNNIKYVSLDTEKYDGVYGVMASGDKYASIYEARYYFSEYHNIHYSDTFTILLVPNETFDNSQFAQVEIFGKTIIVNNPGIIGDVNDDKSVNASDAAYILICAAQQGAGQPDDMDFNTVVGDADLDASISASDASLVLIYSAVAGAGQVDCSFEDWMIKHYGKIYNI